jgi:hypothetical protein
VRITLPPGDLVALHARAAALRTGGVDAPDAALIFLGALATVDALEAGGSDDDLVLAADSAYVGALLLVG